MFRKFYINVVVVWTQRVMSFHVEPEASADVMKLPFHVLADSIFMFGEKLGTRTFR